MTRVPATDESRTSVGSTWRLSPASTPHTMPAIAEDSAGYPMIEASVIIPTRDRPDDLRRCLEALSRQRTARRFEVLVVDDSAGPSTVPQVAGGLEVAAISSGGRGPGAARNAGVAAARGALVL